MSAFYRDGRGWDTIFDDSCGCDSFGGPYNALASIASSLEFRAKEAEKAASLALELIDETPASEARYNLARIFREVGVICAAASTRLWEKLP
jgi:hypothetical protein